MPFLGFVLISGVLGEHDSGLPLGTLLAHIMGALRVTLNLDDDPVYAMNEYPARRKALLTSRMNPYILLHLCFPGQVAGQFRCLHY